MTDQVQDPSIRSSTYFTFLNKAFDPKHSLFCFLSHTWEMHIASQRSWYKVWSWLVSLNKSQSSMCPHMHTPRLHPQTWRWHNKDHILLSHAQVMSALFLIPKAVSEGCWERDTVCRSEPRPSHKSSHVRAANPKRAERHSSLTHMLSQ